jgi:hypothetical protein
VGQNPGTPPDGRRSLIKTNAPRDRPIHGCQPPPILLPGFIVFNHGDKIFYLENNHFQEYGGG